MKIIYKHDFVEVFADGISSFPDNMFQCSVHDNQRL